MKVQALEHTDVRGKKLWYISIENGGEPLLINVGQKNYNRVKELTKQQELPLQEPKQNQMVQTKKIRKR